MPDFENHRRRVPAHRLLRNVASAYPPRVAQALKTTSEAACACAEATKDAKAVLGDARILHKGKSLVESEPDVPPWQQDFRYRLLRNPDKVERISQVIPGGLAWLNKQPGVDGCRCEAWLRDCCSPAERALRKCLREPISTFVHPHVPETRPKDEATGGRENQTIHRGIGGDDLQTQRARTVRKLRFLVSETGKCHSKTSPLLAAGLRRIARLEGLEIAGGRPDNGALNRQVPAENSVVAQYRHGCAARGRLDSNTSATFANLLERSRLAVADVATIARSASLETSSVTAATKREDQESFAVICRLLVGPAESDEQRAWAIFCWIASHAASSLGHRECANLYTAMVVQAGIESHVVTGWVRDATCSVGQDVFNDQACEHSWNAVRMEETWILVDCVWGSRLQRATGTDLCFRPYYFGPPPSELNLTHFPQDDNWQLVAIPVTKPDFVEQPIVTDAFFGSGMAFLSEERPKGEVKITAPGEGSICFRTSVPVTLRVCLDGEEERCLQTDGPASDISVVHFCVPAGFSTGLLDIFVRCGSEDPKESRLLRACKFRVSAIIFDDQDTIRCSDG